MGVRFVVLIAIWLSSVSGIHAQPPLAVSEEVVAVQDAVTAAISRCESSVVAIQGTRMPLATRLLAPPDQFAPLRPADDPLDNVHTLRGEFGTGVILDGSGLILTHFEVIRDMDVVEVTTTDRRTYPAQVVGADERSGLAVLSIQASGLPAISLGDARSIRKGQFVVALGNPYGIASDGQVSASFGIVSNVGRKSSIGPRQETASLGELGWLIQTDAKLNLGTSGGALVDLRGQMVGLTTSVAATAGYDQAAGYAIPADHAFRRIVESLRQGREVEYGLLGVYLENLGDRGGLFGLQPQGAIVRDVMPGGPADQAGIRTGDVITHVDDTRITTSDALMLTVSQKPPLATTEIRFLRDEREQTVRVGLSKAVPRGEQVVTAVVSSWRGLRVDFATAIESYADASREGATDPQGCVAVRHVEPHSPAWNAGLRTGAFISHVAQRRVASPSAFYALVGQQVGTVALRVMARQNKSEQVFVPDT